MRKKYQTSFVNPATGKATLHYRGPIEDARSALAMTFEHLANTAGADRQRWIEGLVALCGFGGSGTFVFRGPDGFTYYIHESKEEN